MTLFAENIGKKSARDVPILVNYRSRGAEKTGLGAKDRHFSPCEALICDVTCRI